MTNKDQHRQSVETLGLSGHGDTTILAKITSLLEYYYRCDPHERNTRNLLIRIQWLTEEVK